MLETARCTALRCRRTIARGGRCAWLLLVLFPMLGGCSTEGGQTGDEGKHSGGGVPSPGGTGGDTSGAMAGEGGMAAGGVVGMGGEGESAGSASGGTGGTAGMCVTLVGDYKTCVLDHQNKRDAATACTPGAPDQCQDVIRNECGCQIAVNDADSPEVACYLEAIAAGACSLCTPEPCAAPLGECEVARDRPTFCR